MKNFLLVNTKKCFLKIKYFSKKKKNNSQKKVKFEKNKGSTYEIKNYNSPLSEKKKKQNFQKFFFKGKNKKKSLFLKNLLKISCYFWKICDFAISIDKILKKNIFLINSKNFFQKLKKIKKFSIPKKIKKSLKNRKMIKSKKTKGGPHEFSQGGPKEFLDYRSNGSYGGSDYEDNYKSRMSNKNIMKVNYDIKKIYKKRNTNTDYKKNNNEDMFHNINKMQFFDFKIPKKKKKKF